MEPTEIDEFRKQVEEGGENQMRGVSLTISILAALVAIVTVVGHRSHTEAVLLQARASDTWNEYQAKKIRQHEDEIASAALSLQPNANQAAIGKKIEDYKTHIEKVNEDNQENSAKAKEYEADVALTERRASRYDLSEMLLQIAVVLCPITLVTRQRGFFFTAMVLGLGGFLIAASAFLLR